MSFAVSPGVEIREFDLTTVIPAVDASVGAYAGVFRWGPVGERVLLSSENDLVARFGAPTNFNAEGWFSAAGFLAYSGALYVVRAAQYGTANGQTDVLTAIANSGSVANVESQVVLNDDHYEVKRGTFDPDVLWVARFPGEMGNSLRISQIDSAEQFSSTIDLSALGAGATLEMTTGSSNALITIEGTTEESVEEGANTIATSLTPTDLIRLGSTTTGQQYLRLASIGAPVVTNASSSDWTATIEVQFRDELRTHSDVEMTGNLSRYWEFFEVVTSAPGQTTYQAAQGNSAVMDEIHVVVVDEGGKFTGQPGTILEVFQGMSRATDAKTDDNLVNYYAEVVNQRSRYVRFANDRADAVSNTALLLTPSTETAPSSLRFGSGADGADEANVSIGALVTAYDLYRDPEKVDIGLVVTGKARGGTLGGALPNYLIDNIAEPRKDCVVFVSPGRAAVVGQVGNEAQNVVDFRNTLRATSYAFLDSGYKYTYDRYNDVYRFVPLNGDMAGLAARTDATNDAWWSPAGFNRGHVRNVVRLAWNPTKAERDLLYKNDVNPVVSFPGQGTVLFGDKTLLGKPSAFSRINVRRLFIVLEKAVATAAKFSLFEFNDEFTRAQFRNMVSPYLRDVKGRRGITDFLVVCDSNNNPGSVIDRQEFVGDIYVKPNRSINFITLNFVAVGSSVSFSEVVGNFG